MMILIPYKTLSYETRLTKVEFNNRLRIHAEFSRTKGFFISMTDDFLLKMKVRGDKILVKRKLGGRRFFPSKIVLSVTDTDPTIINVRIIPKIGGILFCILLAFWILLIPFPWIVKMFFIGMIYTLGMIGFVFDTWWTRDLFEKKLLD